MSKGDGQKIAVKFTENIISDINTNSQLMVETQDGIWTAIGTYGSTNIIDRAKDANLSTYWESRAANYVQVDLRQVSAFIHGIKVYCGASYRPTTYTISVSMDGITYNQVATGSVVAATGWQTFLIGAYTRANFVRIAFGYVTRLYLYELSLLVGDYIAGFKITGQQYKYVKGPLISKNYVIAAVEAHPTEARAVLITTTDLARFPTVEGNLTVEYDATKGTLAGLGGAVQSFTETFAPADLVPEPNPGIEDYVTVAPTAVIADFLEVVYAKAYNNETDDTITASPAAVTADLINIDIINP